MILIKVILAFTLITSSFGNYDTVLKMRAFARLAIPNFSSVSSNQPSLTSTINIVSKTILLTSYWVGDSTGSGKCTGSGICSQDFDTNENGWYTYDGFVVVATATKECFNSNYGACSKYTTPPQGFEVYAYYDLLLFKYESKTYIGIVLDSCGACSIKAKGDDYLQRFDIFASQRSAAVGKVKAELIKIR